MLSELRNKHSFLLDLFSRLDCNMVGQNPPLSSLLFEEKQYSPTFEVGALVFVEEA